MHIVDFDRCRLHLSPECPLVAAQERPGGALDRAAVSEYLDRVSQARRRPGDERAMAPGDPLEGSRL